MRPVRPRRARGHRVAGGAGGARHRAAVPAAADQHRWRCPMLREIERRGGDLTEAERRECLLPRGRDPRRDPRPQAAQRRRARAGHDRPPPRRVVTLLDEGGIDDLDDAGARARARPARRRDPRARRPTRSSPAPCPRSRRSRSRSSGCGASDDGSASALGSDADGRRGRSLARDPAAGRRALTLDDVARAVTLHPTPYARAERIGETAPTSETGATLTCRRAGSPMPALCRKSESGRQPEYRPDSPPRHSPAYPSRRVNGGVTHEERHLAITIMTCWRTSAQSSFWGTDGGQLRRFACRASSAESRAPRKTGGRHRGTRGVQRGVQTLRPVSR